MSSMVIAEKPSQAREFEAAVGAQYGPILAARGHLFVLADPKTEDPAFENWSIEVMRPESGFYRTVLDTRDPDLQRRYAAIRDAARRVSRIYVATDPDREGEGIGTNIINYLRQDIDWSGEVLRVLPLGSDTKSLQVQFAAARPAAEFKGLFQSFVARAQSDQIFNLSLTRSATVAFLPKGTKGASLSIGRVLTPTFGMVCRRHHEIEGFEPRKYFTPWVEVVGAAGTVRLVHSPKEEDRIFDLEAAQAIEQSARDFAGPIQVVEHRKRQGPPPLFSLSKLQIEAARCMRWGVGKTTEVLQRLYQDHKIVTYPRSSEVSIPEAEIENVFTMRCAVLGLPFIGEVSWGTVEPSIRRGKGAFSDADLKGAAHYAIIPNVNTAAEWGAIYPRLDADEKRLFEIIVRRYLAMLGPDRVYDSKLMSISPKGRPFAARGVVEVSSGWKEAMDGVGPTGSEGEDEGADEVVSALPAFGDGDPVRTTKTGVVHKLTAPPPAYTEATLALAMIEAWKVVGDPEVRAALKEARGIGTDATRQDIIPNLMNRGFVRTASGKLIPTDEGMEFYKVLERYTPQLLDVGLTGQMEIELEAVKSGEVGARTAVERIVKLADYAVAQFIEGRDAGLVVPVPPTTHGKGKRRRGKGGKKPGRPTEGMKAAAKAKAQRDGGSAPPDGVLDDFDKCRSYLGPLPKKGTGGSAGRPSVKQTDFANNIAQKKGVKVPPGAMETRRALSAWIDANR